MGKARSEAFCKLAEARYALAPTPGTAIERRLASAIGLIDAGQPKAAKEYLLKAISQVRKLQQAIANRKPGPKKGTDGARRTGLAAKARWRDPNFREKHCEPFGARLNAAKAANSRLRAASEGAAK